MIKVYKNDGKKLSVIGDNLKSIEKHTWVNVVAPSTSEIDLLSSELDIPRDFFTDPLDPDERSRIEKEDDVSLIILRIPQFLGVDEEVPFITFPIGIILTGNVILTVSKQDNRIIDDFINGRVRNFNVEYKSRFILHIFLRTAILYLNYLKEINKRTNEVENELHRSMKNEELIKLLNVEKCLVYFITSLRSNELMMERLQKTTILHLTEEDIDFLEDVIIENKQAIEMANIYSNILSGMMDAFASVISNNLNVVMKFLTSITIILMIPTLIASFYGMNVKLPFQNSPHAFLITIGMSIVLSTLGIFIFIRRKWF